METHHKITHQWRTMLLELTT